MIYCEEDVVPKGGRAPFIPPGLPIGASAGYFPWYISLGDYIPFCTKIVK